MELLRAATPGDDATRSRPRLWAAAAGAATAGLGWCVPVLLVLLGALAVPRASAGAGEAIGSGSLLWLVLGGARLHLGSGTLALTPLVGALLLVLLARAGARRGLPEEPDLDLQGAWLGGYAGAGVLITLLGLLSPAGPVLWTLALPLVVVPALGLVWAHGLPERAAEQWDRVPVWLRRAVRPGLTGAALLLALGTALVLLATLLHIGRVAHIQSELGAGFFGGLLLVVLQVGLLPNLGIWGVSFVAGPGFATTGGAMTTWSGAESGLLPMIPVLAAQPQPGDLPWVTPVVVLLPVIAGGLLARWSLAAVPRLAATQTKLATTAGAVGIAALTVVALDAVAGGSLGGARLSDIGAPALPLAAALVVELGLGALVVVARDWWQLRR